MYNRAFRQVFYLSPKHGNPSPLEGFPMCQSRVLVVLVAPKVQTAPATNEMGPYQLSIIMYSRYNICIILSDRYIYIYIHIHIYSKLLSYIMLSCFSMFPNYITICGETGSCFQLSPKISVVIMLNWNSMH